MSISTISHAEQYLTAFNQIEGMARKLHGSDGKWDSFATVLRSVRKKHRIINSYADELNDYADLRNAIVHSRKRDQIIAYPAEETVKRIQLIARELLTPPKVISLFQKQVYTVATTSSLSHALNIMKDKNISQLPIVDGRNVVEILNGNSISRWLSVQEIVDPADTLVVDLLTCIERKKNFAFVNRDTDVYEAASIYENSLKDGWYMDALLITKDGQNGKGLEGIAVLEDIAAYFRNTRKQVDQN